MNTTTAATQAHVTVATIRTWCRIGAVAAVKQAGRWIIDQASLAARIAIGTMRTRKATPMIDTDATYTGQLFSDQAPREFTVKIKQRTNRIGENIITVRGIIPLLADKLDAITDAGDRMASLNILLNTVIVISDTASADWEGDPLAREGGKLRTTYSGGVPGVSVDDILDLAAQLRTQLAA